MGTDNTQSGQRTKLELQMAAFSITSWKSMSQLAADSYQNDCTRSDLYGNSLFRDTCGETNHRRKLHVELGNSDMNTAETMHAFETFCKSCTGTESNSDAAH